MKNRKTILAAAVLIIVSALILSASVTALANNEPGDAAFEAGGSIVPDLPAQVESPKSVAEFLQEQSAFKAETANGIVLYAGDLFEAALNARGNGMSEEELGLIINDTVQMYNQYGEIVLTNAYTLPGFAYLYDADYLAANDHLSTPAVRAGDDAVIHSFGANGTYFRDEVGKKDVYEDLMCIVEYRIEMADSRLTSGYHKEEYMLNGSDWVHTVKAGTPGSNWFGPSSYIKYDRICMLALGEADEQPEFGFTISFDYSTGDDSISNSYNGDEPLIVFASNDVKITSGDNVYGYKSLNVGRNGVDKVKTGRHDLTIKGFEFDRNVMLEQTAVLYPEYDANTRTALLGSDEYDIEVGMSFRELVDAYGIPYMNYQKGYSEIVSYDAPPVFHGEQGQPEIEWADDPDGLWLFYVYGGYYVTTDGKLYTVYFSHDGEFSVTGIDCRDLF
ncbi:MAG: hypothetical protein J5925_05750 [Clostridia bacterium]|nr:hypothetical protein [Clostridia bacterium]